MRIRGARAGKRRIWTTAAVAAGGVVLLAAGCSTSGAGGSSAGGSSVLSAKQMSQMRADVAAAQKVPKFTSPGPAIRDVGALKGQKIMAIPGSSQLAACQQMVEAEKSLGDAVGTPVTIYNNDGQTRQWVSGIETAISGGYKAVILTCSIDPLSIVPAIQDAARHGVKVVDYAVTQPVTPKSYPGLASGVAESVVQDSKLSVEQAFVHSGGKPFSMLLITSHAVEGEPLAVAAVKKKMHALCGSACKIYPVDVEVPDWSTKIQSTVQSNLLTHPDISVVYPLYSGEYLFALPAIEASHRSNVIMVGGFGNGTPEIQLQLSSPGDKIVLGQISSYADWAAYEAYYQTALVLAGQAPRPYADTFTPNVLTTPANAKAVLSGVGGYGDAFVNGYRRLFGLPPLHGAALTAAATVGASAK
ncbi:MAG: substrate-binding domain-containing protein [Nocardiopsaceae bacterium]|nr:substrate-binding domain-containing protein [Nocardiopsaceae bacterium]